jgi:hypothetical protein
VDSTAGGDALYLQPRKIARIATTLVERISHVDDGRRADSVSGMPV